MLDTNIGGLRRFDAPRKRNKMMISSLSPDEIVALIIRRSKIWKGRYRQSNTNKMRQNIISQSIKLAYDTKNGLGDSCPTATPVRIRKQGFRTIVYVGSYRTIFLKLSIKYDG